MICYYKLGLYDMLLKVDVYNMLLKVDVYNMVLKVGLHLHAIRSWFI